MKRADATSMVVIDGKKARKPVGLITEPDIVRAVADGKYLDEVRILAPMTHDPTVIRASASTREAASIMVAGHFRHLPVTDDGGSLREIAGILDISKALLGSRPGDLSRPISSYHQLPPYESGDLPPPTGLISFCYAMRLA
jgi:CBS domain-containing protein